MWEVSSVFTVEGEHDYDVREDIQDYIDNQYIKAIS